MDNKIRVVIYGIGAIGSSVARAALSRRGLELVGAIDISKDKVGKDLGELLGLGRTIGVTVSDDPEDLFSRIRADVVLHSTSSYLKDVYPQLEACIKAEMNVVSTCEELSYPYYKYPELSRELDEMAKEYGVAVLGTGINPGYLMDTLPILLTAPCLEVRRIKVTRMMDSSKRRIPFQKKIGTGLTVEEFNRMIEERKITGHVGLVESIAMIADALGWKMDEIKELPPEAVIAERELVTSYATVRPGQVAGLKSVAHGVRGEESMITLEFISHADVKEEYDAISIEGVPSINQKISGGIHGDLGTVAMVINSIPKVLNAQPGLWTMKDLTLPSSTPEDMRIYIQWREE